MSKKSPREVLDASLKRLKAEVPSAFTHDDSGPHENLQRFVASGLAATPETFDGELKNHSLIGLFTMKMSPTPTADGRRWTEVIRVADPHYCIGVFDDGDEDPQLYIADVEEKWDDRMNVPLPGGAGPLARLSELLPKIKRRASEDAKAKKAKAKSGVAAIPAVWTQLELEGSLRESTFEPLLCGGRALVVAVRERVDSDPNAGLAIVEGDMRTVIPVSRARATNIRGAVWSGDELVVLGTDKVGVSYLGSVTRDGATWTLKELWFTDQTSTLHRVGGIVATESLFAFATRTASNVQDATTIHVWRRTESGWGEGGTCVVPYFVQVMVAHGGAIFVSGYQNVRVAHQIEIDATGVAAVERPAESVPENGVFASASMPVPLSKNTYARKATPVGDDAFVALAQTDRKPDGIVGYVLSNGALVPWFELTGASHVDRDRLNSPEQLVVAGNEVFIYWGSYIKQIQRAPLPPRP